MKYKPWRIILLKFNPSTIKQWKFQVFYFLFSFHSTAFKSFSEQTLSSKMQFSNSKWMCSCSSHGWRVNMFKSIFLVWELMKSTFIAFLSSLEAALHLQRLCTMVLTYLQRNVDASLCKEMNQLTFHKMAVDRRICSDIAIYWIKYFDRIKINSIILIMTRNLLLCFLKKILSQWQKLRSIFSASRHYYKSWWQIKLSIGLMVVAQ